MRLDTTPLALHDSEVVDVWQVSVAGAPIAELYALLSAAEKERAERFVFDRDRDQFVVVRASLRQLLSRYLDRSPHDVAFALGPQGKPRIAEDSDLHFNVSHSGDIGLLAFRRGKEIGVDVEQANARVEIDELAKTCFSTFELSAFRQLGGQSRADRFFQLWAAKEAYIKALGGGLSIPLQDFSVDIRPDEERWSVATSLQSHVHAALSIHRVSTPVGYAGAIATSGEWIAAFRDLVLVTRQHHQAAPRRSAAGDTTPRVDRD